MNINDACHYATELVGESPEAINNGLCFQWASLVFDLVPGSKIAGENIDGHGHSWVEYGMWCYDSETPDGVQDWKDLPFFRRVITSQQVETFYIDCGAETNPGKGSARCKNCWEDRCGTET